MTARRPDRPWPPYRVAVVGWLASIGLLLAALPLFFLRQFVATFLLIAFAAPTASMVAETMSRCPKCKKSPFRQSIGHWLRIGRFWPERVCSDCGTDLRLDAPLAAPARRAAK